MSQQGSMHDKARASGAGIIPRPPFAVPPDAGTMFERRAQRLAHLAAGHPLAPYLSFLSDLAQGQHAVLHGLSPLPPVAEGAPQVAVTHGMPRLAPDLVYGDGLDLAIEGLCAWIGRSARSAPAAALDAAAVLMDAPAKQRRSEARAVMMRHDQPEHRVRQNLMAAALQVHLARLASSIEPSELHAVADAVCPVCGGGVMTSSIVRWPNAANSRYCTCALCGTMWNVVRVKCLICSSTEGITYRTVEGISAIKAETCAGCRNYVKVLYETEDAQIEALADDVASIGLDMVLSQEGWTRAGTNIFLAGY